MDNRKNTGVPMIMCKNTEVPLIISYLLWLIKLNILRELVFEFYIRKYSKLK